MQSRFVSGNDVVDWEGLIAKVRSPCGGCPRNGSKFPVIFDRKKSLSNVEFMVVSQEPGFWLRADDMKAEANLQRLCRTGKPISSEVKTANPLSKMIQIFGNFDPAMDRVYWTHALKCIPAKSDRDINKEWRKAATRCEDMFLDELRIVGSKDLTIIAFGKYALELCLHTFENQDIEQELSISEFMQNHRLPLKYKYKFKDGTVKTFTMFIYGNPSNEVVTVKKSGGKMTVEEIQDLETGRLQELFLEKRAK
jgi:hypothetical protein